MSASALISIRSPMSRSDQLASATVKPARQRRGLRWLRTFSRSICTVVHVLVERICFRRSTYSPIGNSSCVRRAVPVSYTHLTLPTILLV